MAPRLDLGIDLIIIAVLFIGIWLFRRPRSARAGNFTAAAALALAIVLVFLRNDLLQPHIITVALLIGSAAGWIVANRVNMLQIPAMVGLQNGAGGMASMLVSAIELSRHAGVLSGVARFSGIIGLIVGAATLSGSVIASGKLAGKIRQTPVVWPRHNWIFGAVLLAILIVAVLASGVSLALVAVIPLIVLSLALGIVFSIRVGGADMPVLISFLNSTSGLAAAFCGIVVQNRLLIACGATVAASGGILTQVMCRAMNRNLLNVFVGFDAKADYDRTKVLEEGGEKAAKPAEAGAADPLAEASRILREARTIIFVPGYGMALAQAQFVVNHLAGHLEKLGKQVRFAIHPVAGRMPGHMNVLLAEADVPYDKLFEMKNINADFSATDAAVVVGASDVVNPAAQKVKGTPISGMPILDAHAARNVVVCNLDDRPGYSGVRNSLYDRPNAILLFGDARDTLKRLLADISGDVSVLEKY